MAESETVIRTRKYAINGIEIQCDEVGRGGVPLLLLHGYTGHREDFREVLERSGDLGWLVAPDLRGHGDATHTGDASSYHFDQLLLDLVRLLELLEVERCHLLGHSMGGMVSLRFALAHPGQLASLILMNTSPDLPAAISPNYFETMGELARAQGMDAVQRRVEEQSRRAESRRPGNDQVEKWADRYWPHHRKRYRAMDPQGYASLGRAMAQQRAVTERLSEVRCPTLVIVGDGDTAFLPGSRILAAGIPGAQLELIPDSGHHPQQENPDAWHAAIRQHLKRCASESTGDRRGL